MLFQRLVEDYFLKGSKRLAKRAIERAAIWTTCVRIAVLIHC
ncbi:hypothetical protein HSIEG1_1851 [Enterococcus sp. HSIEG1]|nr:hypothetical protein HSIEG1_1851 [Enterococcus sp. HSIEG1]